MPAHNGFSCWIEVDGEKLREHKVELDEDGVTARCWIESELDKSFLVYWTDDVKECPTVGKLVVDGQLCDMPVLEPRNWDWPAIVEGAYIDNRRVARLCFARIKVTDEEQDAFQDHNIIKDIGNIRVTISEIVIKGKATLVEQPRAPIGAILETNVKAGVHHVAFGEEATAWVDETLMYEPVGDPRVVFVFRYRPRDMLEAQGLLEERTPTPDTPDVKPKIELENSPPTENNANGSTSAGPSGSGVAQTHEQDDNDDADDDENDERIRQLEAELAAVRERREKRRRDGDGGSPTKRVKREPA